MWPILLKLGPLTLHTYGALLAIGFLAGFFYMTYLGRNYGLSKDALAELAWISLLAGIVGARFLYVLFNGGYFALFPWEILKIWQGGLVWYGGLIFAVLAGWIWCRWRITSFALAADVALPGAALGHAIGRLGCFTAGCCYGKPTQLAWGVTFSHPRTLAVTGVSLHPTQLYEACLDFALFGLLALTARRVPGIVGTGRLAFVYVGGYALIRLAVEFVRGDDRGPLFLSLTSTQWLAVTSFAVSIVFFITRKKNA